jgi:hypothetical protein
MYQVARYKERFGFPPSVLSKDNEGAVYDMWSTEVFPRHLRSIEALIAKARQSSGAFSL